MLVNGTRVKFYYTIPKDNNKISGLGRVVCFGEFSSIILVTKAQSSMHGSLTFKKPFKIKNEFIKVIKTESMKQHTEKSHIKKGEAKSVVVVLNTPTKKGGFNTYPDSSKDYIQGYLYESITGLWLRPAKYYADLYRE